MSYNRIGTQSLNPYKDSPTPGSEDNSMSHQSVSDFSIDAATPTQLFDDTEDDPLHANPHQDEKLGFSQSFLNMRGFLNLSTLAAIALALLMLFLGYPVLSFIQKTFSTTPATDAVQRASNVVQRGLVDPDTPQDVYNRTYANDGSSWHLVFSDEFNQEGRTFWPGDDPYFEAVDLWYWGTGDYEWYSPEAVNTTGGALVITLDEYEKNNKNFRSGMVQSWNKLCFQGGYIEIAAKLPGKHNSPGYWPGLWTQGNLGRPGYGATNEGMWPYSYSSCDTGILPNQTFLNKTGPAKAMDAHGEFSDQYNYELSWLPGMRFPSCTCAGEDHPGPNNNVGRSSPEIDILEANINLTSGHGQSSQSLQMAPFDIDYFYGNKTGVNVELYNLSKTRQNDYTGGTIQESISALSRVPDTAYQYSTPNQYSTFGIQWEPDWKGDGSNAYVTWFMDGEPTWTVYGNAIGAVPELDISQRLIPREPMSIIFNVAISASFQQPNWEEMVFPGQMSIDYIRVYQLDGRADKVSCNPDDYPTYDYINRNKDLYFNPNITTFPKDRIPKNKLTGC
ncbi:beta-glucan synthesis-associated protein [Thecaphora frezii]